MKRLGMYNWGLLTALLASLAIAGCNGANKTAGDPAAADAGDSRPATDTDTLPVETGRAGLVPAARPPISDLPVPLGFALIEDISRDETVGDRRTVNHTYSGREDKYDVDRFYAEQMPLKGWISASRKMDQGTIVHRYSKANEQCVVTLTDSKTLTGRRATIHVSVKPRTAP